MLRFEGFLRTVGLSLAVVSLSLAGCDGGDGNNTGGSNAGGSNTGGSETGGGGSNTGGTGGTGCVPEAEICGDGIDNDCDGLTDDADSDCSECQPGETTSCYTGPAGTEGVGLCAAGTATCGADGTFGACEGDVTPGEEICDGKDNDCNGIVDDDPTDAGGSCLASAVGECSTGTFTCNNGTIECTPGEPTEELCDGLDNDCNGEVDNDPIDAGNACDTGNMGECAAGTETCVAGLIECTQNTMSSAELCDGLDNDCDGTVDNDPTDAGGACDTGAMGECANGFQECQNGALVCPQTVMPTMEICDGLDNNCDGAVDDGDPGGGAACGTGLPGECAAGMTACQNGAVACVQTTMATAEACDGLDNDCDGSVDNGNPGGGAACGTGLPGECAAGTTACTGGAIACNQNVQPSAEACDGLDNDCDGTVDNGNPGGGMACSTGLPGVCATGTSACTGGAIVCNQTTMASAEICDGLDNDCNGTVDNGNPGGGGSCTVAGLLPPCAAGTNQCQNGAVTCVSNTPPAPETCDNVDNDCDGIVDDGPIALQIYFSEDFSDNGAGWTTAGGWAIGATSASTGQSYGNPDPANDHTTTNDNGVAGVVLGGNVATTIVGQTYLTSPVVNTAGATGKVYLSFWRWLNSDYSPYMVNQVQVYDGATWNTIYQTGGSPGVQDNAWAKQQYDITAYKSATMQVRFGYSRQSGAFTVSGWNIDDLVISNSPHPAIYLADEFSDNSNNWTLGTSWAIGATSASSGQSYGGPDPALDHTPGGNNGVMGVVLGGNAPTNHPYYYTTSKALNTAGAEVLNLSFWRWLNSDYASFMVNQIQVYNGATWNTIYQTGGSPGVQDSAWTAQSFNILAHKASDMQVRIGYTTTSGAFTVSSWNVDDLLVTGGTVCQ